MKNNEIIEDISKCYVIFVDEVSLWWLRLLKKGFRHCYLVFSLDSGMTWLEINPMSNRVFFRSHQYCESYDYLSDLESKEVIVMDVEIIDVGLKTAPIGFFSCVEFVKRSLGIHSLFTITPHQLYKKLKIVGKKS